MGRILITGSSDGLGSLTARALVKRGHSVVLHARNDQRARDARAACPEAETCLVADLSDVSQTEKLARDANTLGAFDAVVHNAGVYTGPYGKTKQGWPGIFAVNTVSPYILTCLINPTPKRLVYVSSGLHNGGDPSLEDLTWRRRGERRFSDSQAYADTKLHNVMLAAAFARRWAGGGVQSNSLDPGWVPTKMGGGHASGDIDAAVETYVLLAEGPPDGVSGKYWFGSRVRSPKAQADDEALQDRLIEQLQEITGVRMP
ncbi:uncharacterized protein PV06_08566 [Exophiala oligosperma]|uniref:Uncharacterized protein n=2 Tax=Chaetothyriales TaxID=34395 RepID=A0A0D2DX25_9EURO|nr:uncharacterized protein PV06_08566 [Exophiala oligosperma]KAJ9633982.1 hypothetical protein H2204_006529 [Knufia peltigerae]KIW40009.1 hypothetical protein PV06_08566 [Exophiala oligosperma]